MTLSITRRLLVSNLVVLTAFLGLAGAALDNAFRNSVETATRDHLQAHVYTLLTAAQEDKAGRMRLPTQLAAPAFNRPDSGLYAEANGENGSYRWRSASLLGKPLTLLRAVAPGETRFRYTPRFALLDQGILWEDDAGTGIAYSVTVALDRSALERQQSAFRTTLWRWLGGVTVLLLLVLLMLIRWGLNPLREMSSAVGRLETGQASHIDIQVPRELQGLSNNLNALIELSGQRQERVRNSLADLAHSMKTPLAVLRGAGEKTHDPALRELIDEQTRRINDIVGYQRQRAAVAGGSAITRAVALAPILQRLCASLDKVHRDRRIDCHLDIPDGEQVRADPGDLFELFGNLLENAYRHCRHKVRVSLQRQAGQILIDVEDDGDGVAETDVERLVKRGERADQRHPGEGIGLSVVAEIVTQYGGTLAIRRSPMGGAQFRLILPVTPSSTECQVPTARR